jgi:hypothetical protein
LIAAWNPTKAKWATACQGKACHSAKKPSGEGISESETAPTAPTADVVITDMVITDMVITDMVYAVLANLRPRLVERHKGRVAPHPAE